MNINEMQAGREIDALIAEKVMKIPVDVATEIDGGVVFHTSAPAVQHYSTDIAAAWQVVEKMKQSHQVCLTLVNLQFDSKYWQALFKDEYNKDSWEWGQVYYAFADTPELAICQAALRFVLIDSEAISKEEAYAKYKQGAEKRKS